MEKANDRDKGDRFFLELVLQRRHDQTLLRVSEFLYRNKSQSDLCILENLSWTSKVWINVILNVKNQAEWVIYFIEDMSRLIRETHDQYINIIIVDFGNNGLDIEEEMKR
jgi:hypothetical protein